MSGVHKGIISEPYCTMKLIDSQRLAVDPYGILEDSTWQPVALYASPVVRDQWRLIFGNIPKTMSLITRRIVICSSKDTVFYTPCEHCAVFWFVAQ